MNKRGFLLLAAGALALAACGKKNTDQLNESEAQNVEANSLNDLAANAANAEMEALGTPAQQNVAENVAAPSEDNASESDSVKTDPSKVEDDVQGM